MKKKIISSILSLAMLLSLLPVAAFAVEPSTTNDEETSALELTGYGFLWNGDTTSTGTVYTLGDKLPGGATVSTNDWMGQTLYVALKNTSGTDQNLWFRATVTKSTDTSGADPEVWGCLGSVGASNTVGTQAVSFLNRVGQWELCPRNDATGLAVGDKVKVEIFTSATAFNIKDNPTKADYEAFDNTWTDPADVTFNFTVPEKYSGNGSDDGSSDLKVAAKPEIVAVGYNDDATKAYQGINADVKKVTGTDTDVVPQNDVDKQTMWIVVQDLEPSESDKNYTLVVTGPDDRALALKSGSPTDKVGPGTGFNTETGRTVIYWTFNKDASEQGGTVVDNASLTAGTYTFQIQKGINSSATNIGDSMTLKLAKFIIDDNNATGTGENATPATGSTAFYQLGEGGITVTMPDAPTKDGFIFQGWSNGTATVQAGTTVTLTEAKDYTYTAQWKAEPTGTELDVTVPTEDLLGKTASDLQGTLTITPSTDGKTFSITGDSNYAFGYTGYSSTAAQQEGNYIALKFLVADGASVVIKGSNAVSEAGKPLDEDGIAILRLQHFDKTATVEVTNGDGDNSTETYTINLEGINRKNAVITNIVNPTVETDGVTATYANGVITLSGLIDFGETASKELTLNASMTGLTGTRAVTVTVAKATDGTLSAENVTLCGNTLTVDTSKLFAKTAAEPVVEAPVVSVDHPENATEEQKTAMNAAATVLSDDDAVSFDATVMTDLANEVASKVTTTVNAELKTVDNATKTAINDGDASEDLKTIATAITTVESDENADIAGVNLVTQVYMDVKVTNAEVSTTDSKTLSLTFEITPMQQTVLTTATPGAGTIEVLGESNLGSANAIVVSEATAITNMTTPTQVTLTLPADFTEAANVWVDHLKNGTTYHYLGSVEDNVLTFTSRHGFSSFTVRANATMVAMIGEEGYETLQDAVNAVAVAGGGTIDIISATPGTATVSNAITITLTKSGAAASANPAIDLTTLLTAAGNFELSDGYPTTNSDTGAVTYKFEAKSGTGGGTGGGGGGGSTTKPTDPTNPTNPTDPGNTSKTEFTDVTADAYYADAVKWAVEKGITNGLTATTFGPNNSCTRGQMVTFLWRAAGSPATTGTNSFSDVASGEYYYNAVLWAVEKGITNGTSATTFSPNATVNRGQTVTFLYRYAESPAATGDTSFTDVAADAFYADAVKWAVAEEITNGTSSTTFSPASDCTRGQIVTFMYRQMAE